MFNTVSVAVSDISIFRGCGDGEEFLLQHMGTVYVAEEAHSAFGYRKLYSYVLVVIADAHTT